MWLEEVKKIWRSGPKAHKRAKGAQGESMRGGVWGASPRKLYKFWNANHGIWWHLASLIGSWHPACTKRNYIQKGKLFLMFSQIQSTSNTSLIQITYILKQLSKVETVNFTTSSWVYLSCTSLLEDLGIPVICNGFVWGEVPSFSFFNGLFTDQRSKHQHITVCRWDVQHGLHTQTSIKKQTRWLASHCHSPRS